MSLASNIKEIAVDFSCHFFKVVCASLTSIVHRFEIEVETIESKRRLFNFSHVPSAPATHAIIFELNERFLGRQLIKFLVLLHNGQGVKPIHCTMYLVVISAATTWRSLLSSPLRTDSSNQTDKIG